MNGFLSQTWGRCLLGGALVIAALCCVVGFSLDTTGFWGNLLAEVTGVVISVLVVLLLVDRVARHQRELRWHKVRGLTYAAMAAHLCDALSELFIYFPIADHQPMARVQQGRNKPSADTPSAISHMAAQLRAMPSAVTAEKSTSDCAVEYYNEIKWDIDQIRDVLIPRLIESSPDQDLIDSAVAFDQAARDLHNAIIIHQQVVTHGVLPTVVMLVERSRGLYEVLAENWIRDTASGTTT